MEANINSSLEINFLRELDLHTHLFLILIGLRRINSETVIFLFQSCMSSTVLVPLYEFHCMKIPLEKKKSNSRKITYNFLDVFI